MAYYQYDGLPENHIRLIRILPNSHTSHAVEIVLETHQINDVEFDALSYMWGAPTIPLQEEADGQIFTVVQRCYPVLYEGQLIRCTKSLRDALRRLRTYHDVAKGDTFKKVSRKPKLPLTWADGICINQDDLVERSAQVAVMGRIYERAFQTLAYVGELDEGSRTAFAMVEKLNRLCAVDHFEVSRQGFYDDKFHATLHTRRSTSAEWWEWAIFLSRTWFQRTWVLQEIAKQLDRVTVICGPLVSPLLIILGSISGIIAMDWQLDVAGEMRSVLDQRHRYSLHAETAMKWLLKSDHPFHALQHAWLQGRKPSFQQLSRDVLTQTQCSDPRDKIYATLGFARDWSKWNSAFLPIDYTMDVGEVFARATKHCIHLSGRLDILGSRAERCTSRNYVVPSWSPDYDEPDNRPLTYSMSYGLDFLRPLWCAARRSESQLSYHHENIRELHLQGILCDTIDFSASLDSFFNGCSTIHEPLQILLKAIERCERARQDIAHAFFRTLTIFGREANSQLSVWGALGAEGYTESSLSLFGEVWTTIISAFIWRHNEGPLGHDLLSSLTELGLLIPKLTQHCPELGPCLPNMDFLIADLCQRLEWGAGGDDAYVQARLAEQDLVGGDEERRYLIARIAPTVAAVCSGRRLFWTMSGRIGSGHTSLACQDQIWLLAGAKMPMILRPYDGGRMTLVGEAYVDGLMFGEAWPEDENGLVEIILV